MPHSDSFFGMNSIPEDFLDFGTTPGHNPSFSASSDIDMDFGSPFMPTIDNDFIDPTTIGGQEDTSNASTPVQSNVGRVWPGMHQQQAAIAKAQAQEQQKQQQARAAQQSQSKHHARNSSSSTRPTDPIVEERISRLLSQMRQSSVSSIDDGTGSSNINSTSTHLTRSRKDEEDMDEDERLLASEEGKKLSSKERRQLRNKVSARAFRSRRKGTNPSQLIILSYANFGAEYIGQLEGEVAGKVKEADDLRVENEALRAENIRLTDLTRMLLSSPAFSTFLDDLSNNNNPKASAAIAASVAEHASSTTPPQSQQSRKDPNPSQYSQQQNQNQGSMHVGMALLPDDHMNFSAFEPSNNTWNSTMDLGFNNAQVFSVREVPQGPAVDHVDIGLLSGKSSNSVGYYSTDDSKDEAPVLKDVPAPPAIDTETKDIGQINEDVELDESNPAFALFVDCPASPATAKADEYRVFGEIEPEKALAHLDLVVDDGDEEVVDSATVARFRRMCAGVEAISARISAVTSHL